MGVCESEITAAAAKYQIPEGILYSVGLTETGRKGSLQPFAMNIEGKAYFENSAGDVLQRFASARAQGAKLIDLGCMQINYYFHGENFTSPDEMLNPRKNVEYAAKFLSNLHARHETWTMAVARYHAGPNNDPAQKEICLPGHRQSGRNRLRKMDNERDEFLPITQLISELTIAFTASTDCGNIEIEK